MPAPFVPPTCFCRGRLTRWHKDKGRGLILPGQLGNVSWVDETFKIVAKREMLLKICPRAAWQEHWGCGMEGAGEQLSGQRAHQRLLSTLAKFPRCLRATLCFLSGYCRYETTLELNCEGP